MPNAQVSLAGPFDAWPGGLGFDYFFGFIAAESHKWQPRLIRNVIQFETNVAGVVDGPPKRVTLARVPDNKDLGCAHLVVLRRVTYIAMASGNIVGFAMTSKPKRT